MQVLLARWAEVVQSFWY